MAKSILITGVPGVGKSTVCSALKDRGYSAYDMEEIEGLFTMIHPETGDPFDDYDPNDLEDTKKGEWICDTAQLQRHVQNNSRSLTFYGGLPSNWKDLLPLFDEVVLLTVGEDVLRKRLSSRTTNNFGRAPEVQEQVLSWKAWWEKKLREDGTIVVDAEKSLSETTTTVLDEIAKRGTH